MSGTAVPRDAGGSAATEHETWFVEHGDFTRGQCSCGWSGNGRLSRRLAREEVVGHLGSAGVSVTPVAAGVTSGGRAPVARAGAAAEPAP